jgi:hypothetical protein
MTVLRKQKERNNMINSSIFKEEDDIDPATGLPRVSSNMMSDGSQGGIAALLSKAAPQDAHSEEDDMALIRELQAVPSSMNMEDGPVQPQTAPSVKDYLVNKYGLSGKYSDEARAKLAKDSEVGLGSKAMAALAAIGAGLLEKDNILIIIDKWIKIREMMN